MGRLNRRSVLMGAGACFAAQGARAAWPDRAITIIHGFAAGGNADVVARIVANGLAQETGFQFVVEPRPGAGGTIAASALARGAADGYMLGILPGGHAVSAAIYKTLNFNPVDDFTWISMITDMPFIIATYPNHAMKTFSDMAELARKAPEGLLWGSAGTGTGQHLSGELLGSMAKIPLKHVPYRGGSEALLDVLGQRIDFIIDTPTLLLEKVRSGQLRAIAVTSSARSPFLPDVPTLAESGVAHFDVSSWLGLAAPPRLPDAIQSRIGAGVAAILVRPEVVKSLRDLGNVPAPTTGPAFRERVVSDIAKWTQAVAQAHIAKI